MPQTISKNDRKFLFANILLPLFAGLLLYRWLDPDILVFQKAAGLFHFTKQWTKALHSDQIKTAVCSVLHCAVRSNQLIPIWLRRFIRNYFLDMLWAYAFVFALYYLLTLDSFIKNTAHLKQAFLLAVSSAALLEVLQMTAPVSGTFDVCDVLVEVLAEAFAVFIIYKHIFYHSHKRRA